MTTMSIVIEITCLPLDIVGGMVQAYNIRKRKEKEKEMKIIASIWNGNKTRILAIESFDSVKELQDFMKVVNQLDDKASFNLMEVSK